MRKTPICAGALKSWVIALAVTQLGATWEASARTRIHLALDRSIRSFDPRQSVEANSLALHDLIHCSLITFDAEGLLKPGIISGEPVWRSAQVLELSIKEGVKFSDGSPVTAEDVAATWRSMLTDPRPAQPALARLVNDVQAQSQTVTFTLKEADAGFISKLALGILPAKLAKSPKLNSAEIPVCGPFVMKSQDGDRILLEKNPHYTGAAQPRFKEIELKTLSDAKARFTQLQNGELDLVQNSISRASVKGLLKKNPQLDLIKRTGLNTTYLGFNFRDPLAGHLAVREAIAHVINRQEMVEHLLSGLATPASTLLPPSSPFHHKGLQSRPLDLTKAEKLLEDAGFKKKGDVRLELSYKTTTDITQINIAKAIASQLKKIGIKIRVEPMEWKDFEQDARQGRLQLWCLNWSDIKDPDVYREAFSSQNMPADGMNRGAYSNPKLDALLEKGKISSSPEQRRAVYQEVQELVHKDLPYIFLWHEDHFAVVNRALKGFVVRADGRFTSLTEAFFAD